MDKELPVSAWPEWKIIEKIGEGSFGKVYKAQRTERGKSFYSAIKIINIPGSQSELNSVRSVKARRKTSADSLCGWMSGKQLCLMRSIFRIWLRNVFRKSVPWNTFEETLTLSL